MPDTRPCCICDGGDDEGLVLLCDKCNVPHHAECVGHKGPVLGDWFCPSCRTAHGKSRKRGCEVNGATASGTVPWPDEVLFLVTTPTSAASGRASRRSG